MITKSENASILKKRINHSKIKSVVNIVLSDSSPFSIWKGAGGEVAHKKKKSLLSVITLFLLFTATINAQTIVTTNNTPGAFPIISSLGTATIVVDSKDDSLVHIAARLLADDIEKVTGQKPEVRISLGRAKNVILIGNRNKSAFIQQLAKEKKLNLSGLAGKWEGYQISTPKAPFKSVAQALVITGSDRRGKRG